MDQQIVPKKKRELKKKDPYAYTITDKVFGELKVLSTANAWWLTLGKVEALINAYKYGCRNEEAWISAGISDNQFYYFMEKHPEFSGIIKACKEIPNLKARQTVVTQIATDGNLAFKYLERKLPEEFGAKNNIGIAVQVNVGERMKDIKDKYSK
jgi:hypothetical protein